MVAQFFVLWVRIQPGLGCQFIVNFVCQVQIPEKSRSLIKRSPTVCMCVWCVCVCVFEWVEAQQQISTPKISR